MNRESPNKETGILRSMIHERLNRYGDAAGPEEHPNEDTLCDFVEGRLEEAAAQSLISHLIVCGACRRASADLSRTSCNIQVDEYPDEQPATSILDSLASRILPPTQEDAVFAYHTPPEAEENNAVSMTGEPDDSTGPLSPTSDNDPRKD